ncbi:MAG: endonuclease [Clostridia bacterium]|nr:endonuclease [Clostridia bacterium]
MKKRVLALILALLLIPAAILAITPAKAAEKNWNVTCTELPQAALTYYNGFSNTVDEMKAMSGSALISYLETALNGKSTSYGNQRNLFVNSDADVTVSGNILLFFSAASVNGTWDSGSTYNREHVWAKSKGGGNAENDLHHIRPTNPRTNSIHGNYDYGTVDRTKSYNTWTETGGQTQGAVTGYYGISTYNDKTCWEPSDEFKGDTARILAYVYVQFYSDCQSYFSSVVDSYKTLLEWNAADPVDEWEMARNNYVQTLQNNRNIFIDYPELMWTIFDQEIPAGLTTPSGGTGNPTSEPTAEPTAEPTPEPTAEPTDEPTAEPTADPTSEPTA